METKFRFNIERLAFMATLAILLAIVLYCTVDDKDLVWQISLGACFFIPAAYFTVNYFSESPYPGGIFYEIEMHLSKDEIGIFSWSKYFMEFIVFAYVIGALLVMGLVMFLFRLPKLIDFSSENTAEDTNTLLNISHKINLEMEHSANYLAHDKTFLYWTIFIISAVSILAFGFAIFSFIKRKKNLRIAKYSRTLSYILSPTALLIAILFLILHNGFFESHNLKKLLENDITEPNLVLPGQNVVINISNTSRVESIKGNYEVLTYTVKKSEALLTTDSIIVLKDIKINFHEQSLEMKTDDYEKKITPQFEMIIPSDTRLFGSIISIDISLTVKVPKFIKGTYSYDLYNQEMNEKCSFRIANPAEVGFNNKVGTLVGLIWYTLGGCLIFFILTLSFAGNSAYKPK